LLLVAVEFFGTLPQPLSSRVTALEDRLETAALQHRMGLKEVSPLDGIISYLTRKYLGNVADMGIVTITSKSVGYDMEHGPVRNPGNVADLASCFSFGSQDEPGQWICWDFGKMRLRPTHYTIRTECLKSWVVEGSVEGSSWREIGRETDNQVFKDGEQTASFAVSNAADFRFIRLTQTGRNHNGADDLFLVAVEFFGTFVE
jgi:hypothetical protein